MTNFSLFNGFADKHPKSCTLPEVVERIKADKALQVLTKRHRELRRKGLDEEAGRIKSLAPCFGVAVSFAGGKGKQHIAAWTNHTLVDLDHLQEEEMERVLDIVKKDVHTRMAYTTLSGSGVRIIAAFRWSKKEVNSLDNPGITPAKKELLYKQIFAAVNNYYQKLTGIKPDGQCKNPTRLSAMAADSEVFYRETSTPFLAKTLLRDTERPKVAGKHHAPLNKAVKAVQQELARRGVCYVAGGHNRYISEASYLLNRYGVPAQEAEAWALREFIDYGESNVKSIVGSCYRETDEHGTLGLPKLQAQPASMEEIEQFLLSKMRFRYNTINQLYEVQPLDSMEWRPFEDRDLNSLWRELKRQQPVLKHEMESVIKSDFSPSFNPLKTYIEALTPWDEKTDYIGRLADMVTVKQHQEYYRRSFKKWFVAFIAAIFKPEEVNHEIMVFIGKQGTYKSTFFHYLLPPELRSYFCAKLMTTTVSKDDLFKLSQFALVCLEEIDNLKQKELNQLKAIITMRTISERRAYGHFNEHHHHIASFCATGNNPLFLVDRTGNRRFLTVEVEHIKTPQDHPYPYEGIYAQGYALWKGGFQYWFDAQENAEINRHNQEFEAPNKEKELINKYFRHPLPGEIGKFMTATDILERINVSLKEHLNVVRVGQAMNELNFTKVRHGNCRGYRIIEKLFDEISNEQRNIAKQLTEKPQDAEHTDNQTLELPFE